MGAEIMIYSFSKQLQCTYYLKIMWKLLSRVQLFVTPVHGILQAKILEWVAFPFSRGSSQPKDWTQVSRIAGRFFTSWCIRYQKKSKMINTWPLSSEVYSLVGILRHAKKKMMQSIKCKFFSVEKCCSFLSVFSFLLENFLECFFNP